MSKVFYSNASWTKIPDSKDSHSEDIDPLGNYIAAADMCSAIKIRWGKNSPPCSIRGTCTRVWVTDEDGREVSDSDMF